MTDRPSGPDLSGLRIDEPLVPTFAVPLWIILHAISLLQLRWSGRPS